MGANIGFGVSFAFGILIVGIGILCAWKSWSAGSWLSTTGRMKKSDLIDRGLGEDAEYRMDINYTYSVNGIEYTGERVLFGEWGGNLTGHRDMIFEHLRNASLVRVRYNPKRPDQSTLSYGMHKSIPLIILAGMIWLSITAGIFLMKMVEEKGDRNAIFVKEIVVLEKNVGGKGTEEKKGVDTQKASRRGTCHRKSREKAPFHRFL